MRKIFSYIPITLLVILLLGTFGACFFQAYDLFWKPDSKVKPIMFSDSGSQNITATKIPKTEPIPNAHKLWEEKYKISYNPSHTYLNNTIDENYRQLSINPNNLNVYYNLAYCYFVNNNTQKALNLIDKILAVEPNNKNALIAQAYFYYYKKEYNKSLEVINSLEKFEKGNANILVYKAYNTEGLGKLDETIDYYEQVLKIDPANIIARKAIVKLKKNK